jgi:hypothetical protein
MAMNTLRWAALAGLGALLLAAAEPAGTVELKTARYGELGQLIRGLKGQVVVVDFWANY